MGLADDLCPVPPRTPENEKYPGLELTDVQREQVRIAEHAVPVGHGNPDVPVLVYTPKATSDHRRGVVLSIHGGAFVRFRAHTFAGRDAARIERLRPRSRAFGRRGSTARSCGTRYCDAAHPWWRLY